MSSARDEYDCPRGSRITVMSVYVCTHENREAVLFVQRRASWSAVQSGSSNDIASLLLPCCSGSAQQVREASQEMLQRTR